MERPIALNAFGARVALRNGNVADVLAQCNRRNYGTTHYTIANRSNQRIANFLAKLCATQTIDFMLSARRDARAAKRFFLKMLKAAWRSSPRAINVDKNPAYPAAVEQLKEEGTLPNRTQHSSPTFFRSPIREILFRFLHQLSEGDLSRDRAPGPQAIQRLL